MCGFTRFTTMVAAAAAATASVTTGTGQSSCGSATTSMLERMGQPMRSAPRPYDSSTARWPSAVAPPWLPMAGTRNGTAPWSRTHADDPTDDGGEVVQAPRSDGDGDLVAGARRSPRCAARASSVAAATSAQHRLVDPDPDPVEGDVDVSGRRRRSGTRW